MINYNNGKIYKIESNNGEKVYVGSTTKDLLSQRLASHHYNYKAWKKGTNKKKVMSYEMFDEYGFENCRIVLLENYPCTSKDELHSRELYYLKNINNINKMKTGRTKKEYRNDNLEYLNKKKKEWETNTQYRTIKMTCECGVSFNKFQLSRHKLSQKHINFVNNSECTDCIV